VFYPGRTHSSSPTIPISRLRSRRLEVPSQTVRRWYLDPSGKGGATLVAHIKIEEWPSLRP